MSIRAYIPLNSQAVDKDKIHHSWHTFMQALHKVAGGSASSIQMKGDTIQGLNSLNINAELVQLQDTVIDFSGTSESVLLSTSSATASFPGVNPTGSRTGTIKPHYNTSPQEGWIDMDDGTIGNAASGATNRANADTKSLFILLWNEMSTTISGGRGSSALEDFNANKTLTLPQIRDTLIASAGSGTGLTTRIKGDTVGEETHTITESEMAEHGHAIPGKPAGAHLNTVLPEYGAFSIATLPASPDIETLNQQSGSQTARQNMQKTAFINHQIKL